MTRAEFAVSVGLTLGELRKEGMAFLQNEGYDDAGNEHETLGEWLNRKQPKQTVDPIDGGRGAGQYGRED